MKNVQWTKTNLYQLKIEINRKRHPKIYVKLVESFFFVDDVNFVTSLAPKNSCL